MRLWNVLMLQPQPFQVKFQRFFHIFFHCPFCFSSRNTTHDIRRVSGKSRFGFFNDN